MFNRKRKLVMRRGYSFATPYEVMRAPVRLPTVTAQQLDGPQERLETCEQIGDSAWDRFCNSGVAQRLGEMLGLTGDVNDPFSEWSAYHRLLLATSFGIKEIFLGMLGPQARLVTKKIFEGHVYILGGSGTGKTSAAVAQLLIQLARCIQGIAPPIFIFDLKPEGDRYLRATAEKLVRERHAAGCAQVALDFFSNSKDFESQTFDPWQSMQSYSSVKAKAQSLLSALMPTRVDKPDAVFFLNENRELLEAVLEGSKGPPPQSFRELLERLDSLSRGQKGNREARGVHGALSDFNRMPHVRISEKPQAPSNDVDFGRAFDEHRILYIHLDTHSTAASSRSVGRYMLFCLLAEAMRRSARAGTAKDYYLFIDEFHEIASQNIGNLINVARSSGARCILSHQTTASHESPALAEVLLQSTNVQMLLSAEDHAVVQAFTRVAGEKVIRLRGGSEGKSLKHGASTSSTDGGPFDLLGAKLITQWSGTYGESHGLDNSYGTTWQETLVSALTPDMLTDLDSEPLSALVRVKKHGFGSPGRTKWRGISLLKLLYPYTEAEAMRLNSIAWPADISPPEPPTEPAVSKKANRLPKKRLVQPPTELATALKKTTEKYAAGELLPKKKTKTP